MCGGVRRRARRSPLFRQAVRPHGLTERSTMSTREMINPPDLHPAPGFSHVTVANGSRTVYVAGQIALAPDFSIIGGDDLGEQTKAAMRNPKIALDAVGAGWDNVVRRTIYT